MDGSIEIAVREVNEVEARVCARFVGGVAHDVPVKLEGTLSGPYCTGARTLTASIAFRDMGNAGMAEAVVPDPCVWSPQRPLLYRAELQARQGDRVIGEYHGLIGLKRGNEGERR
jgi:hypothetical protein